MNEDRVMAAMFTIVAIGTLLLSAALYIDRRIELAEQRRCREAGGAIIVRDGTWQCAGAAWESPR